MAAPIDLHEVTEREQEARTRYPWRVKACNSTSCASAGSGAVLRAMDEAIDHIEAHSSRHTETIVTENITRARRFLREVDSSSVMVNASTRFADGFEYGLGAEIGISTDKFHARGPVGLEGLTSQKFVVLGDGHVRE